MTDCSAIRMDVVKNSSILVTVEEVLDDVIVVSYGCSRGVFQGALMNSTKKILPCGITLPQSVMSPKTDLDEDKLFSVSQRFTYFQDKLFKSNQNVVKTKKSKLIGRNNMTVRLRPRQVLCSKCKGICNENSENVDHSKKSESVVSERRLSHPGEKSPRPLFSENQQDNQPKATMQPPPVETKTPICNIVPPRVTRLRFCNVDKPERINPRKYWLRPSSQSPSPPSLSSTETIVLPPSASPKTQLSPSVYEMNVNEGEAADSEASIPTEEAEPSPTPDLDPDQDEKMVLRKKRSVGSMEDLWDESVFEESQKKALRTTPVIKISFGSQGEGTVLKIPSKVQMYNPSESEAEEKAARKALKKAKKEARRKLSMSPLLPSEETYRKHRRKEKHKKKHKADVTTWPKLSINLKRLNEKEYNTNKEEVQETVTGGGGGESCSSSSASDEECPPPDFPPATSTHPGVSSWVMSDGNGLSVGDIVWGKVHGFPWWPGKVLSLSESTSSADTPTEAHVSWFGSSTSSMMPCNQLCPFLDFFKLRFNKRKKSSCYKEAIRQATQATKKVPKDVMAMIN
uniref:PWWP domain-containing protein 2B n=2 Tax=Cacopsylla melanoneura TaxID=428564 RepID=A0A8D8YNG4_9HEMI